MIGANTGCDTDFEVLCFLQEFRRKVTRVEGCCDQDFGLVSNSE